MHNLIFFALILSSACTNKQGASIKIVWNNKQATGIIIPDALAGNISADSLKQYLAVRSVSDTTGTNILGDYKLTDEGILFEPLIPFSRGLNYEVLFRNKRISLIEIPLADIADAPALLSIYPTQDTVPENLLKIYLQFSGPMQEGESPKYISLIKNNRDTLHDVFLDLQPELWNEDRTVLTIWLDPGRIKRDLQPNRRLGNPLKKGEEYKLAVSDKWKNVQGLRLNREFTRKIVVGLRDSISTDPDQWVLTIPESGTLQAFKADFKEALDYFLLKETIRILDEKGNAVAGKILINNKEHQYLFTPSSKWVPGNYKLQVETRLEDLAGNNINRPFDRDITSGKVPGSKAIFERPFRIK